MNGYMARLRDQWGDSLLTVLTGLLAVMLFVLAPLQALGYLVFQVSELAVAIILIACVMVLSGSRIAAVAMVAGLVMLVVGAVLRIRSPSMIEMDLVAGSWLIFATTLGWVVARVVFGEGRVTHHRVIGAVLLYLTIAVLFAAMYRFVGAVVPKAFSGMSVTDRPSLASELIYFSFATLTTTGYGDIAPVHPVARSLCNVEAIFGQLYPATLLARLVTLELAHRNQSDEAR
jgi:Ion channel